MAPQTPPPLPSFIWHLTDLYNAYLVPFLPEPVRSFSNTISPFLTSIVAAASNGDIVSLAAFLLTIYLSLKIADYIRRSVIGWVIFFVKIALVLVLVQCAFYVNRNGLENAIEQAEWILGLLWGLVEDKVMGDGGGRDNKTGWTSVYGNGYAGGNGAWGGGRQQVPVGRGRAKGRSGYGWT